MTRLHISQRGKKNRLARRRIKKWGNRFIFWGVSFSKGFMKYELKMDKNGVPAREKSRFTYE